jgi:uncharacterized membrane protein
VLRLIYPALVIAFVAGYALLAHYTNVAGVETLGTMVALAPLLFAAGSLVWQSRRTKVVPVLFVLGCIALVLLWGRIEKHYSFIYWLEHAGTELFLCFVFARTLFGDREPMVTYFARLVQGPLTPALQTYTRQVTKAWVCFFGMMTGISTFLFHFTSIEVWSVFANFFTAPLIALMFLGEYLIRRRLHPRMDHAPILDGVKAYWKHPVR